MCASIGYGKVYKARWKSSLVAVKVVEHSHISKSNSNSPNPGSGKTDPASAEARIAREMLLSTSISHPNVIASYKICTIRVGSVPDSGFAGNEVSLCHNPIWLHGQSAKSNECVKPTSHQDLQ